MNTEFQNEEMPRDPFSPEERDKIILFVSKLYSPDGFKKANGITDVDDKWARDSLEAIGCDLAEADRMALINPELSAGQLAHFVINKGKTPSVEASTEKKPLQPGDEVRVQRTSGDIEDGWKLARLEMDEEGVRYATVTKNEGQPGSLQKTIRYTDLEAVN